MIPAILAVLLGAACFCVGVIVSAWHLARTDYRAIEFHDGSVSMVREP